jgi:hypothetical protein
MKTTISPLMRVTRIAFGASVLLGLAAVIGTGAGAQTPAGGRGKVTFIAIGSDGQPLADLQMSQVELRIDGKPRPMQSLKRVAVGRKPAASAAPGGVFDTPVPPPYGSNAAEPSRTVLVVVDEEAVRPGIDRPLVEALSGFVDGLGPSDQVGLITMPRGTTRVDLTTSKTAVKEGFTKISARRPTSRSSSEEQCHTADVLAGLAAAAHEVAGKAATIVAVTSGLSGPTSAASACQLTTTEFQKVAAAASAAHATFYIVQPELSAASTLNGLQTLAGAVGSEMLSLTAGEGALAKITRESSAYFVAEFDFEGSERDGRSHRVDLRVSADGARVRAPSEVTFPRLDPRATRAARDVVRETRIHTDLPLRVTAYTSRGSSDKVKVVVVMAPVEAGTRLTSASVGLADPAGKLTTLAIGNDDLAKPLIVTALEVAAGSYVVRAAAVDASNRIGTAEYQLDASLTPAGPMKLSGLMLGTPAGPKFEFLDEAEVVVQFEIYGFITDVGRAQGAVELAATPDGPAIDRIEQLQVGRGSAQDIFTAAGAFKIDKLEAGDYVVRVTMGVDDKTGRVIRTLRKVK